MDNIFEEASRTKLKFSTNVGLISVDDLWDLPLQSNKNKVDLDTIAIDIDRRLQTSTKSFVTKKSNANKVLTLQFEIIKRVIDVKLAEVDKKEKAAIRKSEKQKLLAILEEKKDDALKGKSVEEIQEMIDKL